MILVTSQLNKMIKDGLIEGLPEGYHAKGLCVDLRCDQLFQHYGDANLDHLHRHTGIKRPISASQDLRRYRIIPDPKEKRPKIIPLTEQDRAMLQSIPVGFPDLPFFRHLSTHSGCHAGQQFGTRYLWKWWKQACSNLGIEGVDLYGGTRHSTVIYLGEFFTPEQLKKASFHSTNKAFERYYRMRPEEVLGVYSTAQAQATPRQHAKSPK